MIGQSRPDLLPQKIRPPHGAGNLKPECTGFASALSTRWTLRHQTKMALSEGLHAITTVTVDKDVNLEELATKTKTT